TACGDRHPKGHWHPSQRWPSHLTYARSVPKHRRTPLTPAHNLRESRLLRSEPRSGVRVLARFCARYTLQSQPFSTNREGVMSHDATRHWSFTFGVFTVDAARTAVLHGGETVPLTARAFQVLLVLLEARGRTVGKDELLKAVWPDLFVEENNLARQIST